MNSKTMTIHEALAELKLLDRKINTRIGEHPFAVANKHSNSKIDGTTVEGFVNDVEHTMQAILDMLNYRKAIRNALSQSNAVTKIVVGNKEYTVAEAIEMKKTGMELYRTFGYTINNQLHAAKRKCDLENSSLDAKADTYVSNLIGSKDKADLEKAHDIREKYIEANSFEIVTVNRVVERTREIIEEVDTFFSQVDAQISISNATTVITVEW